MRQGGPHDPGRSCLHPTIRRYPTNQTDSQNAGALGAREVRIAERVRSDPSASLEAQQREAHLLRVAGLAAGPPLKDPSSWLDPGNWSALVLRWRAGQAVRAALFADPRTALCATLEQQRYLPDDPWMAIRAAALAVLRSGSEASGPDAGDR
jgi:hypothetical protein